MTSVFLTERNPDNVIDMKRPQFALLLMIIGLIALSPLVVYPFFVMKLLCFALFACAFNLVLGYVGLLSFGHAAFFGMGSYISGWLLKSYGVSAEVAMLAGGMVGALLGLCFGWLAIRREGVYFAMITLALAQMVYFFCLQAPFTGGEDGIQRIPRGALFGRLSLNSDLSMFYVATVVFILGLLFVHRIIHSPFGRF
jgi:branched-chain amino acid transport system permease protein